VTDRRTFLAAAVASGVTVPLAGCTGGPGTEYDGAVVRQRTALGMRPSFHELVRYASLAPSGHNTQPWKFSHRGGLVRIKADPSRRTPVVDPDDHHLFVSLGCATESFVIAALAAGHHCDVSSMSDGAMLHLNGTAPRTTALLAAIPRRQSTRSLFDGRPIAGPAMTSLEAAAVGEGVSVQLLTDTKQRDEILALILAGNNAQIDDPAFVAELKHWIRFNAPAALSHGDGLYSRCSGSPALPSWVGDRVFGMVFTKAGEEAKYVAQIRSSPGIAVFTGDKADPDHWMRVGRSFERFSLQATALEIRVAMINQAVEVPAIRTELATLLGTKGQRPDLVVRFGYAPPMPMSLRRPTNAVIVPFAV
jgi:hypothetical protein